MHIVLWIKSVTKCYIDNNNAEESWEKSKFLFCHIISTYHFLLTDDLNNLNREVFTNNLLAGTLETLSFNCHRHASYPSVLLSPPKVSTVIVSGLDEYHSLQPSILKTELLCRAPTPRTNTYQISWIVACHSYRRCTMYPHSSCSVYSTVGWTAVGRIMYIIDTQYV